MAKPYSMDLRERVVASVEEEGLSPHNHVMAVRRSTPEPFYPDSSAAKSEVSSPRRRSAARVLFAGEETFVQNLNEKR